MTDEARDEGTTEDEGPTAEGRDQAEDVVEELGEHEEELETDEDAGDDA